MLSAVSARQNPAQDPQQFRAWRYGGAVSPETGMGQVAAAKAVREGGVQGGDGWAGTEEIDFAGAENQDVGNDIAGKGGGDPVHDGGGAAVRQGHDAQPPVQAMLGSGQGGLGRVLFFAGDALGVEVGGADGCVFRLGGAHGAHGADMPAIIGGHQGQMAGPALGRQAEQVKHLFQRGLVLRRRAVMIDDDRSRRQRHVDDQFHQHRNLIAGQGGQGIGMVGQARTPAQAAVAHRLGAKMLFGQGAD